MTRIYDKGAQSREVHARYDFAQIYPARMLAGIPRQGVVMDIGTGVGRDAVAMHDRARGRLLVVGIDPDINNYYKAVEAYPHKEISLCRDWNDVAKVKRNRQIAYLVGEVQNIPEPPLQLRADFINCAAVVMFVPQNEHLAFLQGLHRLVKPYRDVFLRFRTEGLKEGMAAINLRALYNECRMAGFFIDKMPDFPDPPPGSRDFSWHDHLLTAVRRP